MIDTTTSSTSSSYQGFSGEGTTPLSRRRRRTNGSTHDVLSPGATPESMPTISSTSLQRRSCLKGSLPSRGSTSQRTVRTSSVATGEPAIQFQSISHFSELDADTYDSLWLNAADMNSIMEEAKRIVFAMNEGVPIEGAGDDVVDSTLRGLEYMTPEGFDIATSSLDAIQLVLEEQSRQRRKTDWKGKLDWDLIAASVEGVSRHRGRIAHLAGMKDARAVYGPGNFKVDPIASDESNNQSARPLRSRSFDRKRESRRGFLNDKESKGAVAETTRRRRGSGGQLPRRARHSAPEADIVGELSFPIPEKSRSSLL